MELPFQDLTTWNSLQFLKKFDCQRKSLRWIGKSFNENSNAHSSLSYFHFGQISEYFLFEKWRFFEEEQKTSVKSGKIHFWFSNNYFNITNEKRISAIYNFVWNSQNFMLLPYNKIDSLLKKYIRIFRSKIVLLLNSVFQGR